MKFQDSTLNNINVVFEYTTPNLSNVSVLLPNQLTLSKLKFPDVLG